MSEFAREVCVRVEWVFLAGSIVMPQVVRYAPGATRGQVAATFLIFMGVALLARVGRVKLGVYKSDAV